MCESPQVVLVASGGWVSSVGLVYVDHRELSMRAITPEASRQAEGVILTLAAHVVETGAKLHPGDAFALADTVFRIEHGGPSHLEVVACGRDVVGRPPRRAARAAATRWWTSMR
jgi:hypothetical protein